MADNFTAIDLSQLPEPEVIEQLDYEAIVSDMLADLVDRDETFDALLESDPAYKIIEVCAYRELILRARVNEAARSVMLAYAVGADLDQLAANQNVERLVVDPGDPSAVPPVEPTMESDDDLRHRVQLAPEARTTAGSEGSYVFWALSSDGRVLDAGASSPTPGTVIVSVLQRSGDGIPSQDVLDAVETTLSADSVRPLTDEVIVQAADVQSYSIAATIYTYSGPGADEVIAAAEAAAQAYADENHALGRDVTLSGVYAALHQPGVQRVDLSRPAASIVVDRTQATYCTGITLVNGGVDE